MSQITVKNYSLRCEIKPKVYQNFLESLNGDTENASHHFKDAIKKAIEDHIKGSGQDPKQGNSIFDIQIVF